jgi:hypothetical protein
LAARISHEGVTMNEHLTEWGIVLFALGFMAVCFSPNGSARASASGAAALAGARAWVPIVTFVMGSAMWLVGAVLFAAGRDQPFLGASLAGAWIAGTGLKIRKRQLECGAASDDRFLSAPMVMVLVAASLMIGSYFVDTARGAGTMPLLLGKSLAGVGALLAVWTIALGHHLYFGMRSRGGSTTLARAFSANPVGLLGVLSGAMVTAGLLLLLVGG